MEIFNWTLVILSFSTYQSLALLTDPLYSISKQRQQVVSESMHYIFEREAFRVEKAVIFRLIIQEAESVYSRVLHFDDEIYWQRHIDPKKPVTFEMSTILSSSDDVWPNELGRLMLPHTNFIRIDWKHAILDGGLGVESVPAVGRYIGKFVKKLKDMYPNMPIYMIGFGAGAHGLAVAARNCGDHTVDAIFALDPIDGEVEPRFLHPSVSLSGDDAKYVQILKCSLWGTDQVPAHDVFLINGGGVQPGCGVSSKNRINCSSFQCVKLFATSLNKSRPVYDQTGRVKLGFWADRDKQAFSHHHVNYDFKW